MTNPFLPEGRLLYTPENTAACASLSDLRRAMETGIILEGRAVLCTAGHDLVVEVGPFSGVILRPDTAIGIAEGTTRDIAIISRVGKPICFTVTSIEGNECSPVIYLSRKKAQLKALAWCTSLPSGTVIPATVTHLERFGAFVDIGCGVPSMIGIEKLSVSLIPHPDRRFAVGQEIYAVVLSTDKESGRVVLSHRELLGTWLENAGRFSQGMTVRGVVRGIKDYGVFIELTPNLSGLAEPRSDLREGEWVSVYIKAILPDSMKIKLLVIDKLPASPPPPLDYFVTSERLERWRYAPTGCRKAGVETVFTMPSDEVSPLPECFP